MGKKPHGKRLLRLDKAQRASISGAQNSKTQTASKGKKKNREEKQSTQNVGTDSVHQMHAIRRITQTGMSGPRALGAYSSRQEILLIGEGDFSFSLSLASAMGGSNIVSTALDKLSQLQVKYGKSVNSTIASLEGLGAEVHLQVDATSLQDYDFIRSKNGDHRKFSRIIFNFPDVGNLEGSPLDPQLNVDLVAAFFQAAAPLLLDDFAEIHVAVRFDQLEILNIEESATDAGLHCLSIQDFDLQSFPGYRPQHTHPNTKGNAPFACAKQYIFRRATTTTALPGVAASAARPSHKPGPAGQDSEGDDDLDEEEAAHGRAAGADEDASAAAAARRKKAAAKRRKKEMRKKEAREWQDCLYRRRAEEQQQGVKKEDKKTSQARAAVAFLLGR